MSEDISDIDRMMEKRGLKLYKIAMRKGKSPDLTYRKRFLTKEDKAVIDSVHAYLNSLGPPEPHTTEETRQWQEFRGALLQDDIRKEQRKRSKTA